MLSIYCICDYYVSQPTHTYTMSCMQFFAEVERLLGANLQSKFPALASTIITYAKATAESVAVQNVSAMWDHNLEGTQPL